MGTGVSIERSRAEINKLRERELNTKEEIDKEWDQEEMKVISKLARLQSERNDLAQRLASTEVSLAQQREGWRKEKEKTMTLTYSSLPLVLLSEQDLELLERKSILPLIKTFPMVTIAHSDVVGFSRLMERLKPKEAINVLDHLHALIDEAYRSEDIFIIDRSANGCMAATGLTETLSEERHLREPSLSSLSLADSSYGSESHLVDLDKKQSKKHKNGKQPNTKKLHPASYYTSQLATAVLTLVSSSSKVHVPILGRKQLQLRVALHAGPCTGGVLGLQVAAGVHRVPQFKVLGRTVEHANTLCKTGLALQIRISKQCKDLLSCSGHSFEFERCPDYKTLATGKPIESYWLVGEKNLKVKLPSLDLSIPLDEYTDININ